MLSRSIRIGAGLKNAGDHRRDCVWILKRLWMRSVKARINGIERELPNGATVAALIRELGVQSAGVAVALNDRIVQRAAHEHTTIAEGDSVEIVHAVAGG